MAKKTYQVVLWDGGKNYTISVDGALFEVVLKECAKGVELDHLEINLATPEYGQIVLKDSTEVLEACVQFHNP